MYGLSETMPLTGTCTEDDELAKRQQLEARMLPLYDVEVRKMKIDKTVSCNGDPD